jgi:hypothetical protein
MSTAYLPTDGTDCGAAVATAAGFGLINVWVLLAEILR